MRTLAILILTSTAVLAADASHMTDADLRSAWVDVCFKQQTMNGGAMPKEFVAECEPIRVEWFKRQEKTRADIGSADKKKLQELLAPKK